MKNEMNNSLKVIESFSISLDADKKGRWGNLRMVNQVSFDIDKTSENEWIEKIKKMEEIIKNMRDEIDKYIDYPVYIEGKNKKCMNYGCEMAATRSQSYSFTDVELCKGHMDVFSELHGDYCFNKGEGGNIALRNSYQICDNMLIERALRSAFMKIFQCWCPGHHHQALKAYNYGSGENVNKMMSRVRWREWYFSATGQSNLYEKRHQFINNDPLFYGMIPIIKEMVDLERNYWNNQDQNQKKEKKDEKNLSDSDSEIDDILENYK